MLTNRLKKFYFEEEHAVILPPDKSENNLQLAATVSANFACLGMTMNADMTRALAKASKEDILAFYQEYVPIVKETMADITDPKMFYPNFPQEVMDKNDIELFVDQALHYLTAGDYIPSDYEAAQMRFPFIGKVQQHPIVPGSEKEFGNLMRNVMNSAVSYSPRQVRMISAFFEDEKTAAKVTPATMKQKENMIILGLIQKDTTKKDTLLRSYLKDPIDVLRYAAVRSDLRDEERRAAKSGNKPMEETADRYLAQSYQKASLMYDKIDRPSFILSKQDRKFCAQQLERIANGNPERLARDMYRHRQDWKRLIKNIHIGDFKDCKNVAAAFDMTSKNISIDRHDKTVEEAIKKGDFMTALVEAAKYPGDLIGRADKFLRMAKTDSEKKTALDMIRRCVQDAGIAKTVGLISTIGTRDKADENRTFVIAKSQRTFQTDKKNRAALDEDVIADVKAACMDGLTEKFRGKADMGKVYISPEMADYTVPTNTRNANDSVETYPTGSKISLHSDSDVQRLFVTWTNMEEDTQDSNGYWRDGQIDIDLSATMYKEDGSFYAHCGWNENYRGKDDTGRPLYVFSGDIIDGGPADGPGAAEYIDLNLEALKQNKIRYVVASVNSYGGQPYIGQPHTSFGTMQRSYDDMGKPFEPQSVETRMRITGDTTHEIPVIYDVYEDKMIWVDREFHGRVASASQDIRPLLDYVTGRVPMSLAELVEVNVRGNGEFVSDPRNADTLYITPVEEKEMRDNGVDLEGKEIIYPYNLAHITGVLMAEPDKDPGRPERELDKMQEPATKEEDDKQGHTEPGRSTMDDLDWER